MAMYSASVVDAANGCLPFAGPAHCAAEQYEHKARCKATAIHVTRVVGVGVAHDGLGARSVGDAEALAARQITQHAGGCLPVRGGGRRHELGQPSHCLRDVGSGADRV